MKEHSHCNIVADMLRARPYVYIKDLRNWCNYRSRLADLRPRFALEGLAVVSCIVENQHAYRLEPLKKPESVVIKAQGQAEMFVGAR